ncbi:uncharacterized protein PSFLO_04201 [Pseudozyma flocculosa]|uniref:CS domain-containing protein n=1 Tax=Pseudozyma flocculosa TaxID=84751 RepID=A0A5C3F317_9BASI|nr:uncharacterized protein PSFLO_04201 [Pseudozyma flocculosa]
MERAEATGRAALEPVMHGWTFHQSHDQATVLFLVGQGVSSRDLEVTIGSDHIVAAVRSQPAIIKARLYGRINTATSSWRIGDKNRSRLKRSTSRSLQRPERRSDSHQAHAGHSSGSNGDGCSTSSTDDPAGQGSATSRGIQGVLDQSAPEASASLPQHSPRSSGSERGLRSPATQSSPQSYGSMDASLVSLRSASSYEVLPPGSRSSQPSAAPSSGTGWSSSSSDVGSNESSAGYLAHSAVLSEPDAAAVAGNHFDYAGRRPRRVRSDLEAFYTSGERSFPATSDPESSVASLAMTGATFDSDAGDSRAGRASSIGVDDASSGPDASSGSGPVVEADMTMGTDGKIKPASAQPPAMRLVTIHLDKIDTGIWPLLVIGPAPLRTENADAAFLRRAAASPLQHGAALPATESLIATRLRSAVREREERRTRQTAERELARALGEALASPQPAQGTERGTGASRATVKAYLNSLAAAPDVPLDDTDDHERPGAVSPSTSRLSVLSTASDDSTTVLGSRPSDPTALPKAQGGRETRGDANYSSLATTDSEADEVERLQELQMEAKYNMDPTTLSLIGLQVADSSSARSAGQERRHLGAPGHGAGALPEAFEYFARAWRVGEIALATERLVQDYLPLLSAASVAEDLSAVKTSGTPPRAPEMATQGSADTFRPRDTDQTHSQLSKAFAARSTVETQRQRLIASLGGSKALARLYLSYARLQLPSASQTRSLLAFPLGQLNSPFVDATAPRPRLAGGLKRKSSVVLSSSGSSRTSSAPPSHGGRVRSGSPPSLRGSVPSIDSFRAGGASPTSSPAASPIHPSGRHGSGEDQVEFLAPTGASDAVVPGPLQFLEEAVRLDESLRGQISAQEWAEALQIDYEEARRRSLDRRGIKQAEEMGSLAGESQGGDLVFDSDGGRSGKNAAADPDAGTLAFVSGAALLGMALAGGVAALGWWRRASGGLSSSA